MKASTIILAFAVTTALGPPLPVPDAPADALAAKAAAETAAAAADAAAAAEPAVPTAPPADGSCDIKCQVDYWLFSVDNDAFIAERALKIA